MEIGWSEFVDVVHQKAIGQVNSLQVQINDLKDEETRIRSEIAELNSLHSDIHDYDQTVNTIKHFLECVSHNGEIDNYKSLQNILEEMISNLRSIPEAQMKYIAAHAGNFEQKCEE